MSCHHGNGEDGDSVYRLSQPGRANALRLLQKLCLMEVAIYPATEDEVRSGFVGRQLREFNYGYVGEYPQVQYIRLNARDVDDQVVGGLRAVVAMYLLRVEVLWVSEAARGNCIGARLLADGERLAIGMGAKNAALETFEWQAPRFCEKHGYEVASRIENYIDGFYLAIMRKTLYGMNE
jgi:GNAT superfamily N-acetyltransferase